MAFYQQILLSIQILADLVVIEYENKIFSSNMEKPCSLSETKMKEGYSYQSKLLSKTVYQSKPIVPEIQTSYISNIELLKQIFNNNQDEYTIKKHVPQRQEKQKIYEEVKTKKQDTIENTFAIPNQTENDEIQLPEVQPQQQIDGQIIDDLLQTVKDVQVKSENESMQLSQSSDDLQYVSQDSQEDNFIEINQSEIDDILYTDLDIQKNNQNQNKKQQKIQQQNVQQNNQQSKQQKIQKQKQLEHIKTLKVQQQKPKVQQIQYQNYLKPTQSSINKIQRDKKIVKKQQVNIPKRNEKQVDKMYSSNDSQHLYMNITHKGMQTQKVNGDFSFRLLNQIDNNHFTIEITQLSTQNRVRRIVDLQTYKKLTGN